MKRFWLAMLSLGLVLVFSASAMAVDVKFSGSFYAAGMYQDVTSFRSTAEAEGEYIAGSLGSVAQGSITGLNLTVASYPSLSVYPTFAQTVAALTSLTYRYHPAGSVGPSTAFYYQRLRLQTDFIVSPGLKLVTRFDALERIWGGARGEAATQTGYLSPFSTAPDATIASSQSAGTRTESQNIAFDWAYIDYVSPIGLFQVGYMADNGWGTVFGNNAINGPSIGKLTYTVPIGPVYINATVSKANDNSMSAITGQTYTTDVDNDSYSVCAIYVPTKDIQIGLLGGYKRVASGRADVYVDPYALPAMVLAYAYTVNPYFKAKFGPVSVEGELNYAIGKGKWEGASVSPVNISYPEIVNGYETDIENLTAYLSAVADFGMFYGGATFAYVSGDKSDTATSKLEGGFIDAGVDFNPTLLMFNQERNFWAGSIPGYGYAYSGMWLGSQGPTPNGGVMSNAWFGQGKIGVRPIAALDIMASLSYAKADQIPTTVLEKAYGWEVDVTATYKITNNLSYMLGGAYLFTGDYYKGTDANDVEDNFLIINKLTLTF